MLTLMIRPNAFDPRDLNHDRDGAEYEVLSETRRTRIVRLRGAVPGGSASSVIWKEPLGWDAADRKEHEGDDQPGRAYEVVDDFAVHELTLLDGATGAA